ncbi:hypothetical protein ACFWOL_03210 [Streptomyces sp. NPDC058442]|uniref:hypothetical protein n=1 Tax=Streptomyces sp. NPDC058442 TaxID=3346503 RepID=UPI00364ECE5E
MGIRMLHRRAGPPPTDADGPTLEAFSPVPVFAAAASTARTPTPLTTGLRRAGRWRTGRAATASLPVPFHGAGEPPPWRLWAELTRGYLELALTLLPRPRPVRTVTVFVAAGETLSVRPYGSAAPYRRPRAPRWPGPDAAP